MRLSVLLLLVPALTLLAACPGSSVSNPDGGALSDGGTHPDGGAGADAGCEVAPVVCPENGSVCGAHRDACGRVVDCGTCRFEEEILDENGRFLDVDTHGAVRVAWWSNQPGGQGRVILGTRQADGQWLKEEITTDVWGPEFFALAASADGTRCAAFLTHEGLRLGCAPPGGAFVIEDVPGLMSVRSVELALFNGMPVVLANALGTVSADGPSAYGTFLAKRGPGGWEVEQLAPILNKNLEATETRLAIGPEGLMVFWRNGETNVVHARFEGPDGVWEEIVATDFGDRDRPNSLAVEVREDGRVTLLHGSRLSGLHLRVRLGRDRWVSEAVAFGFTDRASAFSTAGESVRVAHYGSASLRYSERHDGRWFSQLLSGECDEGQVGMFLDEDARIRVLQSCGGSAVRILTPVAHYPAEYTETCAALVSGFCELGGTCGSEDEDRCFTGAWSSYCSSKSGCASNLSAQLCGDLTRAPEAVYACRDAVAAQPLACNGPAGVPLPEACVELIWP